MATGLWRRSTDAQDQSTGPFSTLPAAVFVDRHRLHSQFRLPVEGRGWKSGIRHHAGVHRTGEREDCDVCSAGFTQGPGAFVGGRTGGEDIIDQEDAFTLDLTGQAQGKRLAKVVQAGRARERGLWIGIEDAHQVPKGYRPPKDGSDAVGEEQGLIEFPAAEAMGVERDRHELVHIQVPRQGLGEQCSQ